MAHFDVEILRTRATGGDADAQFDLAHRYADGDGVPESSATAFRWFLRAAEGGHVDAMVEVGRCYFYASRGVDERPREALYWFRRARGEGSTEVLADLGRLLSDDDAGVRDIDAALAVLEEGWERHGDAECAGVLSALYEEVFEDEPQALRWGHLAADAGDPDSMVSLGYRHRFGEGVPRDLTAMLRWYRAAARLGDATAIANLAICYQNGEGVRRNEARAFELRQDAAERGHARSEVWLAFAWIDGIGCEKDVARGCALLESLARDDPEVAHDYADRLLDGPGVEQDAAAGLVWMRDAASRDYAPALTYLGVLHWYGRFVEQDRAKAIDLYRRAAELGDPYALANVGFATLSGDGVPRDVTVGVELLETAATRGNAHAALWLARQRLGTAEEPVLERDDERAVRTLRTCVDEEEDGDALFLLAELTRDGRGTKQDLEHALELFELAEINGRDTRVERGQLRRRIRGG